jgi:hypothetical protein
MNNNQIKTLVLLKYEIATDRDSWFSLRSTYPSIVISNLNDRWDIFMAGIGESWAWPSSNKEWELYFEWLIEELCEWESKQ